MKKSEQIKIISRFRNEFSTQVLIGGTKYLVFTENEKPCITTRVYLGGEVVATSRAHYGDILESRDLEKNVLRLMEAQHGMAIGKLKADMQRQMKTTSEYLGEVKKLLGRKNSRSALQLLAEALGQYPDDPFLLSYHGCLEAVVNDNYEYGIKACKKAFKSLNERLPFGEEFYYPLFYLNLGRAYLASGRKQEAIEAFKQGVKADRENPDLLWELRKLGLRRGPAVAFLKRSNPINKYIGLLLHRLKR